MVRVQGLRALDPKFYDLIIAEVKSLTVDNEEHQRR